MLVKAKRHMISTPKLPTSPTINGGIQVIVQFSSVILQTAPSAANAQKAKMEVWLAAIRF